MYHDAYIAAQQKTPETIHDIRHAILETLSAWWFGTWFMVDITIVNGDYFMVINQQTLVGGLEHFLFFHLLGMSSYHLTNPYFSEG